MEREADKFASAFLLPPKSFLAEVFSTRLDAFLPLKRRWKVSVQGLVVRCHDLGIVNDDQYLNLFKSISYRKWRKREPYDDELSMEEPLLLNRAATLLLDSGHKNADDIGGALQVNRCVIESLCNLPEHSLDSTWNVAGFTPTLK